MRRTAKRGKDEEYANTEDQRDRHGQAHGPLAGRRVSAVSTIGFAGGDDGGTLQRFHAVPQGFGEDQHAANEGDAANASRKPGAHGLGVAEDVAVGLTHRQAVMAHATDHHTFDYGLPTVKRTSWRRAGGLGSGTATSHPTCATLPGMPSRRRRRAATTRLRRTLPPAGPRRERRLERGGRLPGGPPGFRC